MDVTLTENTVDGGFGEARLDLALTVVAHAASAALGTRRVLADGEGVELGRGGLALGAGVLDDARLSRQHLELVRDGWCVRARDLGSRNGTTVNGAPVGTATLVPGDVLGAGALLLLVHRTRRAYRVPHSPTLVGASAELADVLREVEQVAPRDTTTLVLGETGVGKELVAREIHRLSGRSGRFVALNCGAVGKGLLHSELFGHARGAFSGATDRRAGLVAAAAGGTLFLDEVGDAPPDFQVALLRLLQDREYRPVGDDEVRRTDARFVAATHQPLHAQAEAGRFRKDLCARLSRWVVHVPALHDRRADIPLLLDAFARRHAGRPMRPTRPLVLALLRHDWPGNVRELDALVERLCVAAGDGDRLELDPKVAALLEPRPTPHAEPEPERRYFSGERPDPETLRAHLRAHRGNVKATALALGVGRNTLYRWLREAGVDVADYR